MLSTYHLLIYSHFHISLDDVVNVERKPLAPITNNMHSNNNTLNNSNEASDGSLNYNSHLINTPRSFSPRSTNMHPSILRNAHPSTPCSTNEHPPTSHSDTSFNDDVFR